MWYGSVLLFLLLSTTTGLRKIKMLAGDMTIKGVKTTIVLFSLLFTLRICTSLALHLMKQRIDKIYTNRNNVFQSGTTIFWTIFDVVPLVLIFRIQRANL